MIPGNSLLRRGLRAYIGFSHRHQKALVLLSLVLAAWGVWYSQRIRLDANLDTLLPKDTETIRAMRESKARFGSTDLFTIAIVMDDPDSIARVQDGVKAALEKDWSDAVYVQTSRDNSFFRNHALLYLPPHYLQNILDKLQQVRLNLGMQTPLGGDLLDDDEAADGPKPADMSWFNASIPQQLGLPDEAADAFAEFFKAKKTGDTASKEFDPKDGIPAHLRSRLMGKTPEGQTVGLVQAVLKHPSSDIDYVKTVLARSKTLLQPFQARYGSRLDIGVEGPYRALEEVNSLSRNGMIATVISVGLNLLIILLFFRALGPVLIIGWQAVFSCIMTLVLTALTYGRLNLYTVFVISILFGMGIDFSIYVMGYAQKLVKAGHSWRRALEETLDTLFYSLLVAAVTTIAGLLTLLASKFVGFYEFGVIASMGIVVSFFGTFLIMPSYIFVWESLHARFPVAWLALHPRNARSRHSAFIKTRNWRVLAGRSAFAIGVGTVILACFIPRIRFEYDFDNLRETGGQTHHRPVGVALNSHRASSQPVLVMGRDSAVMDALYDTLLQRLTVERDPHLRSFLTLTTFVPPAASQTERMEYIRQIGGLAQARVFDRATGDDSVMIQRLRELSRTQEFGSGDIPAWALNLLRERDGSYGKIGFIYGSYNSSNTLESGNFQDRYGHFTLNGEHLSAFSSSFIFSDIMRLVKADSRKIFVYMVILLLLLLAFIFRNVKLLLICGIEMAVGVVWILGLMGLFNVKLGAFNIIVISILQGYVIDVCTYLLLGYLKLGRNRLGEIYSNIGVLVIVCTTTTTAGYVGMVFTSHLGIASIGKFAMLGLPALLVTSLGLTPWLCMKFFKDEELPLVVH